MTATVVPVPAGLRLVPDPGLIRLDGGRVLLGGTPLRLMRLSPLGARRVDAWRAGEPVGERRGERTLARRLLDAGLVHPRPTDGPDPTQVTIVVPVRGRAAALRRCLAAVRATAPHSPVIVVDDASPDRLAAVRVATTAGVRCVRRDRRGGPGAARNTGLAAATTPYVAFVDSDCVPVHDWLGELLPHLTDPAVAAVAPRIVAYLPERPDSAAGAPVRGWLTRYEGARSALDMGPGAAVVRPRSRVPYVPSAAVLVRRAAVHDAARRAGIAGAFDEDMPVGEDVDLVWRLAAAGWRVRYEPAATVAHDHRVTPRAWFARRIDYGTSAAPLAARHPGVLPAVSMSGWSAVAWALVATGRPAAGVALTAAVTVRLADRLIPLTERPVPLAARLAGLGTLSAGRLLGSATTRTWWPLAVPAAVAFRRLRLPVAAALLAPAVVDWFTERHAADGCDLDPVRYVTARLLDDVAYSVGVWRGCLRERTVRPLLPHLWWRSAPGDIGGPAT